MKICVKMKWVEAENKWHMMTPGNAFINDFYNCENIQRIFENPQQEKTEMFVVDIHRLSQINKEKKERKNGI